jgi:hypothetical protein
MITENCTPSSQQLYQIVGVAADNSRTVIMSGMQLGEANAARDAILNDPSYVWVMVEREPDS